MLLRQLAAMHVIKLNLEQFYFNVLQLTICMKYDESMMYWCCNCFFGMVTNSAMVSTLIAHCQWEDETVRERTGQWPPALICLSW